MSPILSTLGQQVFTRARMAAHSLLTLRRKHKVCLLGDMSTGKSALVMRLMYDKFEQTYAATIGVDFLTKTLYVENEPHHVQLWDTAGQERFRSLVGAYMRECAVAMIVYDITNKKSADNVDMWIAKVREERGADVVLAIIGNKTDLADKRAVTYEEGSELARKHGAIFMETSAKAGFNVLAVFRRVIRSIPAVSDAVAARAAETADNAQRVELKPLPVKQKSSCTC